MNRFTFQEKGHRYELDGKKMTGVTTVLSVIAKPALIGWAAKMTAEWIRENCKYEMLGKGKGEEQCYDVYESDLQEAVTAHTKKKEAGGAKGTDIHSEVESYVKNCIASGKAELVQGDGPLAKFSEWAVNEGVVFLESEKKVYSEEWFCAGTFDFSFEKDGKRFIGDLKTMKKIWDRTPHAQAAAYQKMSEEMGEQPYNGSCIVNINKETNELTCEWSFDWESDRKAFESALYLYKKLNN